MIISFFTNIIAPVFYKLLFMSVTALMTGVIIMLIRRFADNRISPFWKYMLWVLVLAAMIMPFRLPSNLSLVNNTQAVQEVRFRDDYYAAQSEYHIARQTENPTPQQTEQITQLKQKANWLCIESLVFDTVIPAVWLTGMVAFAVFLAICSLQLNRKIKRASVSIETVRLDAMLDNCRQKLNIQRYVQIIIQNHIKTPALLGLFRSKIILTEYVTHMSDEELEYILLHELSHLKRGDNVTNTLLLILQTIYWFNPLTWFLFKFIRQDMELANDAAVLKNMDKDEQKRYILSLVEVLTGYGETPLVPKLLCMIDGKKNIERRIKMIKLGEFFKKKRLIIAAASLVVIAVMSVLFLTVGQSSNIPPLYIATESGDIIKAARGGYNWNFGTVTPRYEIAEAIPVYQFDYDETNTMTVAKETQLHISNQKRKMDRKYKFKGIVTKVYYSDGTLCDNASLITHYNDDMSQGVLYVSAPNIEGEYIFEIEIEYERGTVFYGFKVVVSDIYIQSNFSDDVIQKMYENKTAYIGDNSKIGGILNAFDLPKQLTWGGMELFTSNKPYGLMVTYKTNQAVYEHYKKSENQAVFQEKALILLCLIDNADYVKCAVSNGESAHVWEYTREWADTVTGRDIREFAADYKTFKAFVNSIYGKYITIPSGFDEAEPGVRVTIHEWSGDASDAEELIYEDTHYQYYLSSIRSDKVMLEFENGDKISLKDALQSKKISIEDLIANGQQMWMYPKDNPYGGYFNIPSHLHKFYIGETEFFPSAAFMYTATVDNKFNAYFALDEFLQYLEQSGYKEKADWFRDSGIRWERDNIIAGVRYLHQSELESIGISVKEGWEYSSHTPVWFEINN